MCVRMSIVGSGDSGKRWDVCVSKNGWKKFVVLIRIVARALFFSASPLQTIALPEHYFINEIRYFKYNTYVTLERVERNFQQSTYKKNMNDTLCIMYMQP